MRYGCISAVQAMLNSARLTDEMCGAADGIRHGAAAVRRNTVSAAYIRCRSSERQNTVQHGGCAEAKSRSCTTHLRRSVKAHAFPRNGTFVMRDIPRIPRKRRGFAAGKRTSDTSLIIIHQKKDVCQYRRRRIFPFGDSGGRFSSPKHGRGRGGTPVSGVRTETNVNAQRRTCRTEVWKKWYAPNAPGCAKIRFPYRKHRTRRIGSTKFRPRKRGYNICEQPRFSRMNSVVLTT